MLEFYYIGPVVLLVVAFLSLSIDWARRASLVVIVSQGINILVMKSLVESASNSNIIGAFFATIMTMVITLYCLNHYKSSSQKILLKLATVNALFTGAHMLYIMSFIKIIVKSSWYLPMGLDFFYWNYANIQIILTLYMVSIFWKSGIMGLSNGFNTIFRLNRTREHVDNVFSFNGSLLNNSNSYCEESKIHKKGIRS